MPCRVFAGLSAALHERDDFDGVGAAQHGLCALVARYDGTVHLDRHASRVKALARDEFVDAERRGDVLLLPPI